MDAIWNANPLITKLYCFEDGNCFINHSDALSYRKAVQADYVVKERPTNEETKEEVKTKKSNK